MRMYDTTKRATTSVALMAIVITIAVSGNFENQLIVDHTDGAALVLPT